VTRIAPEGRPFVLGAWAIATALALLSWWWPLILWLPLAIWTIVFFRDPVRNGPRADELILAPADGLVVSVIPIDEPSFLQGPATRISIFMNVVNVHVNRYPAGGRLRYRHYSPGKFGHAMAEKASVSNEQCSIGIEAARGRLLVRQIAGSVARRIVTDHPEGAEVRQGERMGMIRFGSRVDLFLPDSAEVLVHEGEKTKAGLTVVARWRS
jgi:phosphatidylserine decarboxylase